MKDKKHLNLFNKKIKRVLMVILTFLCIMGVITGCQKNDETPTISINDDGYWVINGEVTSYKATGTNGKDGINGETPVISINDDGYWVINGEVTSYKAIGADGKDGVNGETPTISINNNGYWVINGKVTSYKATGTNGKDGANGETPAISINDEGYWIINGEVTSYKATGTDGKNGTDGSNGVDGTMWHFGKGAPDESLGKDGDCYLDKTTSTIYQKVDGVWYDVAAFGNLNENWNDDNTLKILSIGNSFSDDSLEYVYQVAENLGVQNIKLGNLYIAGCSLETHLSNAKSDAAVYTYHTNDNGTWKTTTNYKMSDAIKSENWDYITFQQSSGDSGVPSTYSSLTELIDYVKSLNDTAKLAWHMTWAYQGNSTHSAFSKYNNDQITMYNAIINAINDKIETNSNIDLVIPVGTAIQNARTSSIGDNLTRDGYHLTYDLGRYIAAVTFVEKLTGLDCTKLTYAPSGVTEEQIAITKDVVKAAIKSPYEITQANLENYLTPLELDITMNAYYNATYDDGSGATPVQNLHVTGWLTKYYAATQIFTREDIPNGSVIVIANGYQYRPEGWTNTTDIVSTSLRPGNVTTTRVIVDDEWWGEWNYRAFNINGVGNSVDMTTKTPDDIKEIFQIYVPNTK